MDKVDVVLLMFVVGNLVGVLGGNGLFFSLIFFEFLILMRVIVECDYVIRCSVE